MIALLLPRRVFTCLLAFMAVGWIARAAVPVVTPTKIYCVAGVPIAPVQLEVTNSPIGFSATDDTGLAVSDSGLISGTPINTSINDQPLALRVQAYNADGYSAAVDVLVYVAHTDFLPTITSVDRSMGLRAKAPPYSVVRIVLLAAPLPAARWPDNAHLYGRQVGGDGILMAQDPSGRAGTYTIAPELVYPATTIAVPNMRGPAFTFVVPQRPGVPILSDITINGQVGVPISPVTISAINPMTRLELEHPFVNEGFYPLGTTAIGGIPTSVENGHVFEITAYNDAGQSDTAYATLNIAPAPPPGPANGGGSPSPPIVLGSGGIQLGTAPQVAVTITVPSFARAQSPSDPPKLPSATVGTSNYSYADLGQPVTFTATFNGATSTPITWQWRKDDQPIAGATSSTFQIAKAEPSAVGKYSCTATAGSQSGSWATQLAIRNPPVISTQTKGEIAATGPSVTLTVHATGEVPPMRFQWYHGGTEITAGTVVTMSGSGSSSGSAVVLPAPAPGTVVAPPAGNAVVSLPGAVIIVPPDGVSTCNVTVASAQDFGPYWCEVTAAGGTTKSDVVTIVAPTEIVKQPAGTAVPAGQSVRIAADVRLGGSWASFQWLHDGIPIPGATAGTYGSNSGGGPTETTSAAILDQLVTTTYTIASAKLSDRGRYTCRIATVAGTFETAAADVAVAPSAHLINISTRVRAGSVAGTPVCGFVVAGGQRLPVLLRGVGPTLGSFGVTGAMAEPTIQLHNPDASVTTFSGWLANRASDMTAIGAFGLAAGSKDVATFLSLAGGKYTGDVVDATGAGGVALLEVYDASGETGVDATLINASTLGYVGTGNEAMFTGFVVKGSGTVKILIRAVGPSLSGFGVAHPLADPKIQIYQGSSLLAENDDWGTRADAQSVATIQAAANSVGAFTIDPATKDAVILRDIPEGMYSAQITGAHGETGTAIVELYTVP